MVLGTGVALRLVSVTEKSYVVVSGTAARPSPIVVLGTGKPQKGRKAARGFRNLSTSWYQEPFSSWFQELIGTWFKEPAYVVTGTMARGIRNRQPH